MSDTDALARAQAEAAQATRNMEGGLPKYAQAHALVSLAHSLVAIAQVLSKPEPTGIVVLPEPITPEQHYRELRRQAAGAAIRRRIELPADLARPHTAGVIVLPDGGWAGQLGDWLPTLPELARWAPIDPGIERPRLVIDGRTWPQTHKFGDWSLSVTSHAGRAVVTAAWHEQNGGQ